MRLFGQERPFHRVIFEGGLQGVKEPVMGITEGRGFQKFCDETDLGAFEKRKSSLAVSDEHRGGGHAVE